VSSNSFFMAILWSWQPDRSDQLILPDSDMKETATAQHRLLLEPKVLVKLPLSGAEAAKEGPSPPLVKGAGTCLHMGPTSSTHSHCQAMPEGAPVPTAKLAGCLSPLHASAQNHRITESQNIMGWKGPLWVI